MLWDAVQAGRRMASKVPFSRWDVDALVASQATWSDEIKARVQWGAFMEDLELFDPGFFRISPAEAASMDPCQRLLLEYGYMALHDAELLRTSLSGSLTGVFVGFAGTEYGQLLAASPAGGSVYAATGASLSIAAGRISFVLGLQGPCCSYDTACAAARRVRAQYFDTTTVCYFLKVIPPPSKKPITSVTVVTTTLPAIAGSWLSF